MPSGPNSLELDRTDHAIEVLVIGGGPGGTPAAMALAEAGRQVMLVEAGPGLGGTCLFAGCIPSKIFRETAFRRREASRAAEFGLGSSSGLLPDIDWNAVQRRRHQILTQRADAALARARTLPSLQLVFGRARLTGPRTALIERVGTPTQSVRFERAILATGSVPSPLAIPGVELPGVLDSDQLIGIGFVPTSVAVIGGGPIGIEMAQIFSMLGAKVTVLEVAPRILGAVDRVLAGLLTEHLKASGIRVETDVTVEDVEGTEDAHRVSYHHAGRSDTIEAQVVAIVAGRHPNVVGLGLEMTAIRHGAQGVVVNGQLETDEPGIFATGDLVGNPMFAHWATAEALAVARHLLGRPADFPRREHNSAVIFSSPEIGIAGLTEEEARAHDMVVAVAEYDYRTDARAQIAGESLGRLRLVYCAGDHRIVGIHVLAEGAADLMGEAALAIRNGLTLEQLAAAIHPHPTLTEAFGLTAQSALADRRHREA